MHKSILKRIIDVVVSAVALVVLLPVLVIVAAAIIIESPGCPFFFQDRVGKDGKIFRIVKFRSMVLDASKIGSAWTQAGDPRIIKVGKFIRSTSIDELPQLWNVLIGEMSLIGPRPILVNDKHYYTAEQWDLRHSVYPGITGLAQVNGRSVLTVEQQIAYDCEYIKSWSIRMDIEIAIKTFMVVLNRTGTN